MVLVGYSVGALVVAKELVDRVYLCMWFVIWLGMWPYLYACQFESNTRSI